LATQGIAPVINRDVLLSVLAAAAAFVLPSGAALGGTFSISPMRLDVSDGSTTAALTVRNEDDAAVVVQAEALLWEQADGKDRLTASRDLLVSPVVFTLPPKGSQLVRVALRRGADTTRELSYRLTLQEVPQPVSPDFNGLNVTLRLSLPVFVAPHDHAEPKLEWTARRDDASALVFTAANSGTAHARVHNFSVATPDGATVIFSEPASAYVLAGQSRSWTTAQHDNNKTPTLSTVADAPVLRLKGKTDTGDFATELPVRR
jgi:fimbrial chaperone protein